jgi:hypothetical protein
MMAQPPYPDPGQQRDDHAFVLKKLGFGQESFERYMAEPPVPQDAYATEKALWDVLYRSHKKLMALRKP